jgi:hypothetical protein
MFFTLTGASLHHTPATGAAVPGSVQATGPHVGRPRRPLVHASGGRLATDPHIASAIGPRAGNWSTHREASLSRPLAPTRPRREAAAPHVVGLQRDEEERCEKHRDEKIYVRR